MVVKKYLELSSKIFLNTGRIWNPTKTIKNNYNTNSWFNITEYTNPNYKKPIKYIIKSAQKEKKLILKCRKIQFFPTNKQRKLLNKWFKTYGIMYNKTLKYLNNLRFTKTKLVLNWRKLRTLLKEIKKELIKLTQVNSHVLDEAIKAACTSYKSALTNYKRKNIKRFRIRYIKLQKSKKILHIEKRFISKTKNTFCKRIFREDFKCENNYQLKNIDSDFKIHYDKYSNRYTFLIPIKIDIKKCNRKNIISLDPGIRTFMTGFSNIKCIGIGDNLKENIKKYIKKIDKIKRSKNVSKQKIKKVESRCYRKIENKINDLHWKAINYLTKNYNKIIVGNMSTHNIVSNKNNSKLHSMTKRLALLMRLYVFKQRLQFKCEEKGIYYKEVDEAYTSKTCTNCALLNNKLGLSKIFDCPYCKSKIDRDINGARNIMLNALY